MNFQVAPKEHYHLCWEPLLWRFGEEGNVVYLLPALLPLHSCCDAAGRRGWEYLSWQGRSSFMLVPATDRLTGYMLSVVGQNCPLSISSKHWGNLCGWRKIVLGWFPPSTSSIMTSHKIYLISWVLGRYASPISFPQKSMTSESTSPHISPVVVPPLQESMIQK